MSAYRMWTLTCDGCGEVFDYGVYFDVRTCKKAARDMGWATGKSRFDADYCRNCKEDNE